MLFINNLYINKVAAVAFSNHYCVSSHCLGEGLKKKVKGGGLRFKDSRGMKKE